MPAAMAVVIVKHVKTIGATNDAPKGDAMMVPTMMNGMVMDVAAKPQGVVVTLPNLARAGGASASLGLENGWRSAGLNVDGSQQACALQTCSLP